MRVRPAFLLATTLACGGGNADEIGIASECASTEECPAITDGGDEVQLECLTQFAGGYCAVTPCSNTDACPDRSICVAHDDGTNYCFRACDEKPQCNANRSEDNEANCSSSFDWADPADDDGSKACIPPSSGN